MSVSPCKDCRFFKPHNNRVVDRVLMNAKSDLEELENKVKEHNSRPWWKFWKFHPDSNGHSRYYLERLIEKFSEKQKGTCQLNPVHVRVSEEHGCGQHQPKA